MHLVSENCESDVYSYMASSNNCLILLSLFVPFFFFFFLPNPIYAQTSSVPINGKIVHVKEVRSIPWGFQESKKMSDMEVHKQNDATDDSTQSQDTPKTTDSLLKRPHPLAQNRQPQRGRHLQNVRSYIYIYITFLLSLKVIKLRVYIQIYKVKV